MTSFNTEPPKTNPFLCSVLRASTTAVHWGIPTSKHITGMLMYIHAYVMPHALGTHWNWAIIKI